MLMRGGWVLDVIKTGSCDGINFLFSPLGEGFFFEMNDGDAISTNSGTKELMAVGSAKFEYANFARNLWIQFFFLLKFEIWIEFRVKKVLFWGPVVSLIDSESGSEGTRCELVTEPTQRPSGKRRPDRWKLRAEQINWVWCSSAGRRMRHGASWESFRPARLFFFVRSVALRVLFSAASAASAAWPASSPPPTQRVKTDVATWRIGLVGTVNLLRLEDCNKCKSPQQPVYSTCLRWST